MARISGCQADPHQLVSFKLLFAAQATNWFVEGIGGDTTSGFDGWSHNSSERGLTPHETATAGPFVGL